MTITELKEEFARENPHYTDPKIYALVDKAALATLDMLEGKLPKFERETQMPPNTPCIPQCHAISEKLVTEETLRNVQALRAEIEPEGDFTMCVNEESCRLRGPSCEGACQMNAERSVE